MYQIWAKSDQKPRSCKKKRLHYDVTPKTAQPVLAYDQHVLMGQFSTPLEWT